MKSKIFSTEDLALSSWQFSIRHKSTKDFKIGDTVFLKCNIELPLTVETTIKNMLMVSWICSDGTKKFADFYPETILQYKYAGLLTYKRKFKICLN